MDRGVEEFTGNIHLNPPILHRHQESRLRDGQEIYGYIGVEM